MKKTVALALGSGSARGYAHIGVIDALEARGYEIVSVSGCSMGAIVGGFYCAGILEEYRQWVCSLRYLDVLKMVDVSLLSSGVIKGDKLYNRIAEMFNGQLIEDLPIPFTAVATDITNHKEVWFQRGPLQEAVRASAAIPSLFTPVNHNGRMLVDGAVLNPLPITPCVSAHADCIIAVDLNADAPVPEETQAQEEERTEKRTAWFNHALDRASQWLENKSAARDQADENLGKLEMLNEVFDIMSASLTRYKIAGYPPDLLINMPANGCGTYEFYRAEEIIAQGRKIADMALDAYEAGESSIYGVSKG